jgi:hypothetical protein
MERVWPFLQRVQQNYASARAGAVGEGGAGEGSSGAEGDGSGGEEGESRGERVADRSDGDGSDGDSGGDGSGGDDDSDTGSSSAGEDQDETILFSWGDLQPPMAPTSAARRPTAQGLGTGDNASGSAVSVTSCVGVSAVEGAGTGVAACVTAGAPEPRFVSSRLFASRDGVAVFPLLSLMNHACRPNAQVIRNHCLRGLRQDYAL